MKSIVKRSLGINVRGNEASFVVLARVAGRIRHLASGTIPLADGAAAPQKDGPGVLAKELRLKRQPEEVIVGLPRRSVVLRTLELPSVDEKDLAGLLAYELERHLPFSPEEAYYAFQRIGKDKGKVVILLAAVKRADLERTIEQVERLGLRPTAVDVAPVAGANAVLRTRRVRNGDRLCLVEQGEREAEVSFMQNGSLEVSRSITLGTEPSAPLLQELRRIAEQRGDTPVKVLVSGAHDAICWRLAREVGLPVEQWNAELAAVEASTYGLALKGLVKLPLQFNLLPQERRTKKADRALVAMYALLLLVGLLGAGWGIGSVYRERTTLGLLNAKLTAVKAEADAVQGLRGELTSLRNQLQTLEEVGRERGRTLVTLKELVTLLPGDITLTDVTLEGGKLQIRGTAGASASQLIATFEKSALFENAAFTSPISAQGNDRQAFQLQAFVKDSDQRSAGYPPQVGGGQPVTGRKQP
jgi:Tfp pilus assembly protein PilN